jgi:hypothetical protein
MQKQIVVIGGGDTFKTYKEYISYLQNIKFDFRKLKIRRWKETLAENFSDNFEVLSMKMPNTANAKFNEWKIMFNKLLPFLKDNVILLGHSLGGIFLAKYLSENKFPRKIKATFLVSTPYYEKDSEYTLGDFKLPKKLDKFQKQGGKIFLYHSKDDPVVPFVDLGKYGKALPEAKISVFKNRKHFDQTKFPELVKDIKDLN